MEILVFGQFRDSLLSSLRKHFPSIIFRKCDLSMELENEGRRLIVMDSVKGVDKVTLVDDLHSISPGKAIEGSGTIMTLRILLRIGSLESAKVIAVPADYPEAIAFSEISAIIGELAKKA